MISISLNRRVTIYPRFLPKLNRGKEWPNSSNEPEEQYSLIKIQIEDGTGEEFDYKCHFKCEGDLTINWSSKFDNQDQKVMYNGCVSNVVKCFEKSHEVPTNDWEPMKYDHFKITAQLTVHPRSINSSFETLIYWPEFDECDDFYQKNEFYQKTKVAERKQSSENDEEINELGEINDFEIIEHLKLCSSRCSISSKSSISSNSLISSLELDYELEENHEFDENNDLEYVESDESNDVDENYPVGVFKTSILNETIVSTSAHIPAFMAFINKIITEYKSDNQPQVLASKLLEAAEIFDLPDLHKMATSFLDYQLTKNYIAEILKMSID